MTGIGTFGIGSGAANYPLRALPLRVGKAFSSNRFDDERERRERKSAAHHDEIGCAKPSRFETEFDAQDSGSRLNSAFAAQVLGQILTENEYAPPSARAVYGMGARNFALACDLVA